MPWQANDFRITVFFQDSSRKLIRPTSFDVFVLQEQVALLVSDERSMLKNYHVFCTKKFFQLSN